MRSAPHAFLSAHGSLDDIGLASRDQPDELTAVFDGLGYDISMRAVRDELVWSVDEDLAGQLAVPASYPSRLWRWVLAEHELWVFPKLAVPLPRHVLMIVDRAHSGLLSVELAPTATPVRAPRILRGALDGPVTYDTLRAFHPADEPRSSRRWGFEAFELRVRSSGVSSISRASVDQVPWHVRGTVLRAGSLRVLPWKAQRDLGVLVWDEESGATLSLRAIDGPTPHGMQGLLVR